MRAPPNSFFELRTDQLRFLVAVDFEVEDGIAYEIFNAPLYEDHHGLMHEIVQSWLHTVGTLSLSELMQDDD